MEDKKEKNESVLPVVQCNGCGVCCFHMGYPAFVLPQDPLSESAVEKLEAESGRPLTATRRRDLLTGRAGETHWHQLPEALKKDWLQHVSDYTKPQYGDSLESFDGPCYWLDVETRMCKHHPYRPQVCRDFETGNPDCLQWRDVYADRILPPL